MNREHLGWETAGWRHTHTPLLWHFEIKGTWVTTGTHDLGLFLWSEARREILPRPYMSSEEEEEESEGRTRRLVKRLAWISPEAINVKKDLDKHYMTNIVTVRQRRTMTKVEGIGSISSRPSPDVQTPCVGYFVTIIPSGHTYVMICFAYLTLPGQFIHSCIKRGTGYSLCFHLLSLEKHLEILQRTQHSGNVKKLSAHIQLDAWD